jgi:hypothetical protein
LEGEPHARPHLPAQEARRHLEPLARRDRPAHRQHRQPARQKTSTHDTKRDAQAWLATITQELRARKVYDTKLTVAGFLIGWLEGGQSLRRSTRQAYRPT